MSDNSFLLILATKGAVYFLFLSLENQTYNSAQDSTNSSNALIA